MFLKSCLEEALLENGFKIVPDSDNPDATISGVIVRYGPGSPYVSDCPEGLLRLQFPNGKVIMKWRAKTTGTGDYKIDAQIARFIKSLMSTVKTDGSNISK